MAPRVRISHVKPNHKLPEIKTKTKCSVPIRIQRNSTNYENNKKSNKKNNNENTESNYSLPCRPYNRSFEARLPTFNEKSEIIKELRKLQDKYYQNKNIFRDSPNKRQSVCY